MSADGQRTKWCRNIVENFNRLSMAHERYRQTYRQTDDRQTDGRWHIANVNVSSLINPGELAQWLLDDRPSTINTVLAIIISIIHVAERSKTTNRNLFAYSLSHDLAFLFHFAVFFVASLLGLSPCLGNLRIFFFGRLVLLVVLVIFVAESSCASQQQQKRL